MPNGTAIPGSACDDGDTTTVDEVYNINCDCIGNQVPGCTDIMACNFDSDATVNDGSCLYPDCEGICFGTAIAGSPYDDGDPTTVNEVYDANCNCVGNTVPSCTDVILSSAQNVA